MFRDVRSVVIRNKARKEALKREQIDRRYPFVILTTGQYCYYPVGSKSKANYYEILNY